MGGDRRFRREWRTIWLQRGTVTGSRIRSVCDRASLNNISMRPGRLLIAVNGDDLWMRHARLGRAEARRLSRRRREPRARERAFRPRSSPLGSVPRPSRSPRWAARSSSAREYPPSKPARERRQRNAGVAPAANARKDQPNGCPSVCSDTQQICCSYVASLVREGGVEPPRPFGHTDLNRARLPIPPLAPALAAWGQPENDSMQPARLLLHGLAVARAWPPRTLGHRGRPSAHATDLETHGTARQLRATSGARRQRRLLEDVPFGGAARRDHRGAAPRARRQGGAWSRATASSCRTTSACSCAAQTSRA